MNRVTTRPQPQQIIARAQQAEAFLRAGQPHQAVTALQPVMPFAEKSYPALVIYARAISMLSQHERAAAVFQKALKLKPSDSGVRTEFAVSLKRSGRFDQSLAQIQRARKTAPWEPRSVMLEAELQMDLGEEEKAIALLDGFDQNAPESARTPHHLSHLCTTRMRLSPKHYDPKPLLDEARVYIDDERIHPKQRALVASRIALLLDKQGEYDAAIEANNRCKKLRAIPWDADDHTRRVEACMKAWTSKAAADLPKSSVDGSGMIFVLGMPRSGSSLLEQMLSRHPDVHPLGERNDITFAAGAIDRPPPRLLPLIGDLSKLTPELCKQIAEHLQRSVREANPAGKPMTVDKQPFNYAHVPLLARLLPGCKVLHTLRDPRDVAVSYHTLWFNGDHGQANSFETLGKYYRDYRRVMDAWAKLPAPDQRPEMMDVHYEHVVAEPERVMRDVLAFVGLDYDPAVLDHTQADRVVATASRDQVKSGLYSSSVARWKRYEKHLGPFIEHAGEYIDDSGGQG
ncbi:MAG: hypothetical protein Phyf2KO_23860 [Phycisphaerales bacterium]